MYEPTYWTKHCYVCEVPFFFNLRLIFIFNSLLQNSLFCVLFDPNSDDEIFEFLKFNLNVQNVNGSRCFII